MSLLKFMVGLVLEQVNKIHHQNPKELEDGSEMAMDKVIETDVVYRQTHHNKQYVVDEPAPRRW